MVSWSSQFLVPPDAETVRFAMLSAGELSESDFFVDRHFIATARAIQAVAISLFMTVGYIALSVYHLCQGSFAKAGEDLLSSLQSIAISSLGLFYITAGFLYPKTFSFFAPYDLKIIHVADTAIQTDPTLQIEENFDFSEDDSTDVETPPLDSNISPSISRPTSPASGENSLHDLHSPHLRPLSPPLSDDSFASSLTGKDVDSDEEELFPPRQMNAEDLLSSLVNYSPPTLPLEEKVAAWGVEMKEALSQYLDLISIETVREELADYPALEQLLACLEPETPMTVEVWLHIFEILEKAPEHPIVAICKPFMQECPAFKVLSCMRRYPHLFAEAIVRAHFTMFLSIKTPHEERSTHFFGDPKIQELLAALETHIASKSVKERRFIQKIMTDLTLFTTLVPTRASIPLLFDASYETIDPFSVQNVAVFAQKILDEESLSSLEFFNGFYLVKERTAVQKLFLLSVLHLREEMQMAILQDPLFQKMLESENLEKMMLATSGNLPQNSLYSCVAAAYNTRLLHKLPNLPALLHQTAFTLDHIKEEYGKMTEEEKATPVFSPTYGKSTGVYVEEELANIEEELQAIHRAAMEDAPMRPLVLRWNLVMQRALSLVYPKKPSWFAKTAFPGHYHTSYTIDLIAQAFNPWSPWFHERRSQGGIPGHLIRRLPAPQDLDADVKPYVRGNPDELFQRVMRHGSLTLTYRVGRGTLHANTLRAAYINGKPHFVHLNPMSDHPRLLTLEAMDSFASSHEVYIGNIEY